MTVANLRKMATIVRASTPGAKTTLSTNVSCHGWKWITTLPELERYNEWHRCCPRGDGSSYRDWLESPRVQTMPW
jgi:hypothetical protein